MENYIFIMNVHIKTKNVFVAKKEHKKTQSKRNYKNITSYPLDGCVPGCREAEGRESRQDERHLST